MSTISKPYLGNTMRLYKMMSTPGQNKVIREYIERLESRIAELEKTVDDLRSSNEDELIQYAVQGKYVFEGYERWLDFGSPFKYLSTALSSAENLSKTRESRVVKTYTRYETLPD